MTHEEFEQAAQYWNRKEQTAMPKEALQQADVFILNQHRTKLWLESLHFA